IEKMMQLHHGDLAGQHVRITALMVHRRNKNGEPVEPAISVGGYPAAACIKITTLKQRVLGLGDALLMIDGNNWDFWSTEYKSAVIDHELTHLVIDWITEPENINDEWRGGRAGYDDANRPILKMRLHDWQHGGFAKIVARHGQTAAEMRNINAMIDAHG